MNVEMLVRTSLIGSPGFSRSRLSLQYATAPAGIQPAKAGTPGSHIRTIFLNFVSALIQFIPERTWSLHCGVRCVVGICSRYLPHLSAWIGTLPWLRTFRIG